MYMKIKTHLGLSLRLLLGFRGTRDRLDWGRLHWGSLHWGSLHWGSLHWGSFHWGSLHWGSLHWGSLWGSWGWLLDSLLFTN